jgi:hypothetical protein
LPITATTGTPGLECNPRHALQGLRLLGRAVVHQVARESDHVSALNHLREQGLR